jgi:hypothetical protein
VSKGTFRVKLSTYVDNQGDGDVVVRFYDTEEEAQKVADHDDERYGENYGNCVETHELTFVDGKLVMQESDARKLREAEEAAEDDPEEE